MKYAHQSRVRYAEVSKGPRDRARSLQNRKEQESRSLEARGGASRRKAGQLRATTRSAELAGLSHARLVEPLETRSVTTKRKCARVPDGTRVRVALRCDASASWLRSLLLQNASYLKNSHPGRIRIRGAGHIECPSIGRWAVLKYERLAGGVAHVREIVGGESGEIRPLGAAPDGFDVISGRSRRRSTVLAAMGWTVCDLPARFG